MAANTSQIFGLASSFAWTTTAMVTANTTKDGTSGTLYYLKRQGGSNWAAGTNGTFVNDVVFRPLGTNSNATVARVWLNNGSTDATAANNTMLTEVTLPPTTNSETAAHSEIAIPINRPIPAGNTIFITLGTAPTSAGWSAWSSGMDY